MNNFIEMAAFGRGSAFGVEAARPTPSKDPNPPEAFSLFPLPPLWLVDHHTKRRICMIQKICHHL
ncbi:hypothetical protein T458_05695 [Brevibacillus panacihumi W25]|uniref:Uncharacterized protein n=1 Tax=Brevibacillus panacihumi W25 TaxID=1408254 RepID=V6MBP2_9BACL|nr:hypothetical protein T458_05695 [Brevibacillus panacihumi W25]